MGLFGRKKKKEEKEELNSEIPELPELPSIKPELPPTEKYSPNNLPSFPNSNLGKKLNQDSIKEVISEKSFGGIPEPPKIQEPEIHPIENPIISPMTKEIKEKNPRTPKISHTEFEKTLPKKREPLFIRLDKFENAISFLNDTKEKITEIESLLANIREIRTKEEEELSNWQKEIQIIKEQIDKLDKEIFSQV